MSERDDLSALRQWLERQGVRPMTQAELLDAAGPYMRLGWRPNGSEGLRFLATALSAPAQQEPEHG